MSEKGFGFIRPEEQGSGDLFFHATGMVDKTKFDEVEVGDQVLYELQQGSEKPRAVEVEVIPEN